LSLASLNKSVNTLGATRAFFALQQGRGLQAASWEQFPDPWVSAISSGSVPRGSDVNVALRPLSGDHEILRLCGRSLTQLPGNADDLLQAFHNTGRVHGDFFGASGQSGNGFFPAGPPHPNPVRLIRKTHDLHGAVL